ncbi:hypothetical protein ACHAWF_004330 [Thalassiosira exigua]
MPSKSLGGNRPRRCTTLLLLPLLVCIPLLLQLQLLKDASRSANTHKDAGERLFLPPRARNDLNLGNNHTLLRNSTIISLSSNHTLLRSIAGAKRTDASHLQEAKRRADELARIAGKPPNLLCLIKKSAPFPSANRTPFGLVDNPLRSVYKVHLWDDGTYCKFREILYNHEGWHYHPNAIMVGSPDEADVVVWITTRARFEAERPPSDSHNVVLLDYSDGCPIHQFRRHLKHEIGYFKRSLVERVDGVYERRCTEDPTVLPFAYSGAEAQINRDVDGERPFVMTNMLRSGGNANEGVRGRAIEWTKNFAETRQYTKDQVLIGTVGHGQSGSNFDGKYLTQLARSKIVITANPNHWEGDSRLWEALLSGALVFVDQMVILDLLPHPFEDGKHLIYYDPHNETAFAQLLSYYVDNEDEARAIGLAGYRHTLDYHMTTSRVTYILTTIESKIVKKDKI